jgi:uncharacterized protein
MGRVVHFEIGVDDPKRAIKFYEKIFGWKTQKWEEGDTDYWLIKTGETGEPGIDGALMQRMLNMPPTVNTISVEDLKATVKKIKAAGGKPITEPNQIPNIGMFCYCVDTEGNVFGILQPTGKM